MTRRFIASLLTAALSFGLVASAAVPLAAQTSTGTVRGYVRSGAERAATGAEVTAKNLASGVARSAVTRADGSYILPGLEPGAYDISARQIGSTPQVKRVQVAIGTTIVVDFDLQAVVVQLQEIAVAGPDR